MFKPFLVALILTFFLLPYPVSADQLADGVVAYDHKDYSAALKLLQPLADHGNAEAQYRIGELYLHGWGVKNDYMEAMKWKRKAGLNGLRATAQHGDAEAQANLAEVYDLGLRKKDGWGEDVQKDPVEALKWHKKSAEQGFGAWSLGYMYDQGRGVKQDKVEAFKWLLKVADSGSGEEQQYVGKAYAEGEVVKQDYIEAYKWYSLAQAAQKPGCCWLFRTSEFDALKEKMTPDQIAEAERRIAAWKPTPVPALKK